MKIFPNAQKKEIQKYKNDLKILKKAILFCLSSQTIIGSVNMARMPMTIS